jgi:hypothetical protein
MDRMRDDERLKVVMTDSLVLPHPTREAEIWFDWALVVFWKAKKGESFRLTAPSTLL